MCVKHVCVCVCNGERAKERSCTDYLRCANKQIYTYKYDLYLCNCLRTCMNCYMCVRTYINTDLLGAHVSIYMRKSICVCMCVMYVCVCVMYVCVCVTYVCVCSRARAYISIYSRRGRVRCVMMCTAIMMVFCRLDYLAAEALVSTLYGYVNICV